MGQVLTVRGPVSTSQLGTTLAHEHVLWHFDDSRRKVSIDFAVKLLSEARLVGVQTLIDLTPHRRIDWLMEIAGQVDVNIAACTGFYREALTPPPLATLSEAQMVSRIVRELTEGIDTTEIRAGIIKVAADHPALTPWETQVFTAAAKAQLRTGACIATHAVAGAREQAQVLLKAGADLNRVFFSHIETQVGWEGRSVKEQGAYLADIARQGGWLLFNNYGCEFYTTWTDQVYLMKYLCDAGYMGKSLISIDVNWIWNAAGQIEFEAAAEHPEAARRTYGYMMTDTVPELLQSGFTEEEIRTYLVDNPRRFFEQSELV